MTKPTEQPQMRTGNCPKCGEDWRTHDYTCKTTEQLKITEIEAKCHKCPWTGMVGECTCDADYPKLYEDDGRLRCPDCSELAIISENTKQLNKPSSANNTGNTLDIKPKTGQEKQENADRHPEQPNQVIVKTIQSLMTVVNDNLMKLPDSPMKSEAIEEIDLFQRTTLNDLQKAFE